MRTLESMDDEQYDGLTKKLDLLIRLTAIAAVRGLSVTEQIRLLDSAGLRPAEIARILNKTPNTVRVLLFGIKKKKKATK